MSPPPAPATLDGRRLLWRYTSVALIGIALISALIGGAIAPASAGIGGSTGSTALSTAR